jgi:membrane-bound ClpP family serine protease
MKPRGQLRLFMLSATIVLLMLSTFYAPVRASTIPANALLIRIDSEIDYKAADLVDKAAKDIEDGKASILLVELNSASGYISPAIQIVERITSIKSKVVAYIGPGSAGALGYSSYIAMASKILAMNEGASIGRAATDTTDSDLFSYLMKTMRQLATANSRNADAAERMVADNVVFSADEAYAEGICDLKVDSYEALLAALKIDAASVVEKTTSQNLNLNRDDAYEVLKFFADPTTIQYMFFGITGLVFVNFILALVRPRRSRNDQGYQTLLDFMRMEMQASGMSSALSAGGAQHETLLQTQENMPFTPTFKVNRLPAPLGEKRVERPLEVKEG